MNIAWMRYLVNQQSITYRYMHAPFHIITRALTWGTISFSRDDNSPESPRADIGWGMITVLNVEKGMHWSIYHISQHWIKKNKINVPHRYQTNGYVWITTAVEPAFCFCFRNTHTSFLAGIFQMTINSWVEVTSWGSREAWYPVIRDLQSAYVWAKSTLLLINMW